MSSIVYTTTNITSTDGEVSIGHHTDYLFVFNKSNATSAVIELNGRHQIVIPHSPDAGSHSYHKIPGDYTTIKIVTTGVSLAAYAVG
jgi:hypothetical protein